MHLFTKNNKKYLILSTIIFLYVFYPPFCSISTHYFLAAFAYIYIILNIKKFYRFLSMKYVLKLVVLMLGSNLYIWFVASLNNESVIDSLYNSLYWIGFYLPICFMIVMFTQKNDLGKEDFFKILCLVGNIQGVFAIISLVSSPFHSWVLNNYIKYGFDADRYTSLANYRLYGLAFHLTNYAPMICAMLIIVCLIYSHHNIKYLLYIPLMFVFVLLNSRTSLMFTIIGCLFAVIVTNYNANHVIRNIALTLAIGLLGIFVITTVLNNSGDWYAGWIRAGFDSIFAFLHGDSSQGYFSYVSSSEVWQLPESFVHMMFGYGQSTLYLNCGFSSDIGFINYIWQGGLIYLVLVIITVFHLLQPLKLIGKKSVWDVGVISFFVLNIKDTLFSVNEYMCFLMLVSLFFFAEQKNVRDVEIKI